jgi:Ribosomal protein L40E
MGLFEDVVINAKSAVNVVGKKAGQFVDISKLRINAADLNNEIGKRFEALGRMVYEAKKTDNASDDLLNEEILKIDELYEQLDELNEQIAALRKISVCKSCGAENPKDAVYCNKCGLKLTEE